MRKGSNRIAILYTNPQRTSCATIRVALGATTPFLINIWVNSFVSREKTKRRCMPKSMARASL